MASNLAAHIAKLGGAASEALEGLERPDCAHCPILSWAASGAMWLTGPRLGAPAWAPGRMIAALEHAAAAIEALSASIGSSVHLDVGETITGRAALLGLRRSGRVSAGGGSQLVEASDAWFAISLARPSDFDLIPALLEAQHAGEPWDAIADAARSSPACEIVDRARLLGLPAATVGEVHGVDAPFSIKCLGTPALRKQRRTVIDLSSLWAGPLCASVLGRSGARVIKVESRTRRDGTRAGSTAFFDALHGGHESVVLDLASTAGRRALKRLVEYADVVIEASRPRALKQMNISPKSFLANGAGRTWVSITGYGRDGDASNRVAYGDDAAAAAGFVAQNSDGGPLFCGDAIADPVAGMYAAAAALGSIATGGGHLVDVAMAHAVAHAMIGCKDGASHGVERLGADRWRARHDDRFAPVSRPSPPITTARARPAGMDTARVLAEVGI
jgi:hypothetical protein